MIIGITGGTGCGKTTLLNVIHSLGGMVLDCDEIYHSLLQSDDSLNAAIKERFPSAFSAEGLDRKELGKLVFSDPRALADLNAITHTAVRREVERRLSAGPKLAAIDAIALFESGLGELCDITVAVTAPEDARIARLVARDGISPEYAHNRIAAQHDSLWFQQHCDFSLENSGTPKEFREKCVDFLNAHGIIS